MQSLSLAFRFVPALPFAASLFLAVFPGASRSDPLPRTVCKGNIRSEFETLHLIANWNVEWPLENPALAPVTLNRLREQICEDVFGFSFPTSKKEVLPMFFNRPDYAQLSIFLQAMEKIIEQNDTHCSRSFEFNADLSFSFYSKGFVGYRLDGYENHGGNGCHSYIIARVFSLDDRRPLCEADFLDLDRLYDLLILIASRAQTEHDLEWAMLGEPDDSDLRDLFAGKHFLFEAHGIRWFIPAYTFFCGAAGVVDVLITWDEMQPYFASREKWDLFRSLDYSSPSPASKSSE